LADAIVKIIAFIGLDGSGKTTQAELFVEYLKSRGLTAVYDHQFRFNSRRSSRLKMLLRPWLHYVLGYLAAEGTALLTPNSDDAASRGPIRRAVTKYILRPPAVTILFVLGLFRHRAKIKRRKAGSVIVFDRYFYDEIIRLEWKFDLSLPLPSMLLRSTEHPSVIFYLHAPADLCWERMEPKDSSKMAMSKKQMIYQKWISRVGGYTHVYEVDTARLTIDEVQDRIRQIYLAHEKKEYESYQRG
jgi:thymidylate kinase